jgi:phosphatidylserine/phosphatidylglycerophosphate/cardiolipin synthase-like enzyme
VASAGPSTVTGPLLSYGNRVVEGPIVDGAALTDAMVRLIGGAKQEVILEFFDFDPNSWMALRLRDAISALPSSVQVFLMAHPATGNYGTGIWGFVTERPRTLVRRLDDFFHDSRVHVGGWKTGVDVRRLFHSKAVIVDGERALLTDTNVQDRADPVGTSEHARGWFQLGMVVEGEVVTALRRDAWDAWEGTYPKRMPLPERAPTPGVPNCTPMVLLSRSAGAGRQASANLGYDFFLRSARRALRIVTPNLNDAMALEAIAAATEQADVSLILSKGFNESTESLPGQGGGNQRNVERLVKKSHSPSRLHIRWFAREVGIPIEGNGEGASHAKWASVDGVAMILGSQNLDTQSWTQSRELNLLVEGADITGRFDALFEQMWNRSAVAFEGERSR